jgi:hypothetical protein
VKSSSVASRTMASKRTLTLLLGGANEAQLLTRVGDKPCRCGGDCEWGGGQSFRRLWRCLPLAFLIGPYRLCLSLCWRHPCAASCIMMTSGLGECISVLRIEGLVCQGNWAHTIAPSTPPFLCPPRWLLNGFVNSLLSKTWPYTRE